MSIPKGFEFCNNCGEVTVVLKDFQVLTGRLKGVFEDRKKHSDDDEPNFHKPSKDCDKHKEKEEEKCCKPPHIDVIVDVEDESEFIVLELTRSAATLSLSAVTCLSLPVVPPVIPTVTGVSLGIAGTTFPIGSCVAINVSNILYVANNADFCDFSLGTIAVPLFG